MSPWGPWGWAVVLILIVVVLLVTQSCLILWDPPDCSPPGSPVHGLLQVRILGVGCHCFLQRRVPWTEEPDRLQSIVSQRVGLDWATNTFRQSGRGKSFSYCCLIVNDYLPCSDTPCFAIYFWAIGSCGGFIPCLPLQCWNFLFSILHNHIIYVNQSAL